MLCMVCHIPSIYPSHVSIYIPGTSGWAKFLPRGGFKRILPGPPFGTQKLVPLYFCTFHIYVFVLGALKKKCSIFCVQTVVQDLKIDWGC